LDFSTFEFFFFRSVLSNFVYFLRDSEGVRDVKGGAQERHGVNAVPTVFRERSLAFFILRTSKKISKLINFLYKKILET
jgi:hypothetical protein